MFTGIITNLAIVDEALKKNNEDLLLTLKLPNQQNLDRNLKIGCSISCSGSCLTLISKKQDKDNFLLDFQASKETLEKTTMKSWEKGKKINIEFALRIGDELGGHLVSGHVDCVSRVTKIEKIEQSHRFTFEIKESLKKFISNKGSVVLDGISLTVNDVFDNKFQVNVIDHTFKNTNFNSLKVDDFVNLEIDQIARYLYNLKLFQ
jgi:riboflavin synthase